ncbi:ACP phosphodiesterase [Streptomyces pluripotens]|uniref:FMN dependent NADH:quinone oxidoreductase n=1 Tax=Streptomyces pluripotens TaxID=1355015 RepID=A0A221P4L3_9ACTN|nr:MULTISPECIES: NAD(P)H-dependent oxidoreductase [Streptomyces]ARP72897.1 ACP phosphodiesterase [Streptomyces pluripotens]ASN27147.1 ACP phosphodiesterase [Streptomyces pluripotens]KIE28889.1 ACP phosphodiesterase [Streptomyces sp. MUSC 125]MCH0559895.1 NAD(P)H-dependent oxidoreductase [Streptomyces sp. MUM 16J]
MSLFRLDTSILGTRSSTVALADLVEQEWRAATPGAPVVRRHLGETPLPPTAWSAAVSTRFTPPDRHTPEQRDALVLAAALTDELVAADAVLCAAPLYNFGVSQHLKAWVDLVLTDPRMAPGGDKPLTGRPAVLVTARGGAYGPGTPRDGWDHAIGWMRRIFSDVWDLELTVVERELTLVGVDPALDRFTELAARTRIAAEEQACAAGRNLALRERASLG